MSLKRALLAIALLGVSVSHTFAQSLKNEIPRLLTYQAQLLDKEGKVVADGEHSITAKLYVDPDAQEFLWGDTYIVHSHGGVVDLMLGSGDNALPASAQLSRSLYLGISLDGADEMRPLLPFTAVPYALNVANNSITASKMATDYVASFSINGQQITSKAGKIDLYAGNGVKLAYDSISNQLMIMGSRSSGAKGEPEVLTVSVYAKEDLVVDGNATFNVDSGKTDVRGNVLLGGATKTTTFRAKAGSDLDMNAFSVNNADSIGVGKLSTVAGVMQIVAKNKNNRVTIMTDSLSANRNYTIPEVGTDAKFVMNTSARILDSLTMGNPSAKQGKLRFVSQDLAHIVTVQADSTSANRKYTIPDVGEDSRFLMTSGLQTIDNPIFTNVVQPSDDNTYALGDPDLRYRDIFMGPGSLHLIADVSDGVTEETDYAQQIDVNPGDGNGDLVFRESGEDLLRVSNAGDVTVTGNTTTSGVTTSGDIQPVDDNTIQIGSEETRIADVYLGPGSLHLIADVSDGVTEPVDYAQQVDVAGEGSGDLVFRESGDDLLRIAPTGDVTVTGSTTTNGVTTSGDIQPADDNTIKIGSEESRIADVYLGPGSLHLIADVSDGVTEPVDYAQQVDVAGEGSGDLVFRESGDDLLRIAPTGDVTVTGSTTTSGVTTSGDIQPAEDNTIQIGSEQTRIADVYLGPGSLHLIADVSDGVTEPVDYAQQVDVAGEGSGDLVFRESGDDLLRIAPTGDVTVTGSTTTGGVTTSGDIQPVVDNTVKIGSEDTRIADLYLGPASIHVSGTSAELNNTGDRDWVLDLLQTGPNAGNFQVLESGNLTLSLTPAGNASVTGKATSAATLAGDGATTLTTKGYVDGIGAAKWNLAGNSGLTASDYIGTSDAAPFIVKTNGTERMRVLSTGKIGINNSNPLTALDVVGDLKVTGPATFVGVLNFDGSLYGVGDGSVSGTFAAKDLIAGSSPSQFGRVFIFDGDGEDAQISTANLSTSRTFTLPDASGTIALTSDISAAAWSKTGNSGTSPATNFIGSTDAQDVVIRANNSERLRANSAGGVTITGDASVTGILAATGAILASSSISANGSIIGATDAILGASVTPGKLRLRDGVFGYSDLKSSATGNNLTFFLPQTSGTLALDGTAWSLSGNAGTGPSNYIGTTDATPLTFKTNGQVRMVLSATGNTQFFGTATLGGDVNATGYSLANVGSIGVDILNVVTQLNVSNVGGHTMVGGLNMNGNDISSVDDITADDLTVDAIDAGGMVTVGDELHIRKPSSAVYSSFEANSAQTSNIVYTLPDVQGTTGSVLQNDGSGNLTWGTHVHREVVNKGAVNVPANSGQSLSISVTGAPTSAAVYVSPENALPAGVIIAYTRVSAADTIEVRLVNLTGSNINVGAMNWAVGVIH